MPADQVIIIRHAQKPTQKPKQMGGTPRRDRRPQIPDRSELAACRGACRSPGWSRLEWGGCVHRASRCDFRGRRWEKKVRIYDSETEVGSHSRRPLQTVTLLAETLKLALVTTHTKGEEQALVDDALGGPGVVLIFWRNQNIATIGDLIVGDDTTLPQNGPEDRYDLIYVFDRV